MAPSSLARRSAFTPKINPPAAAANVTRAAITFPACTALEEGEGASALVAGGSSAEPCIAGDPDESGSLAPESPPSVSSASVMTDDASQEHGARDRVKLTSWIRRRTAVPRFE